MPIYVHIKTRREFGAKHLMASQPANQPASLPSKRNRSGLKYFKDCLLDLGVHTKYLTEPPTTL